MTSPGSVRYRLVVFQKPPNPEPVRDLLTKELAIHPLDAQRLMAHMPGILPGLYDPATSKRLLDALFKLEIPAEARTQESCPDLSRPRNVNDFALTPGGLNIRDSLRKQTLHFLPWDQIGLIAAAKVEQAEVVSEVYPPGITASVIRGVRGMLGGGSLNRKERVVSSSTPPKGEALIWRQRPTAVFRLSEDRLRYDILGEHRAETASENFPRLIRWLAAGATNAFLSHGTQTYLGKSEDSIPVFPSMESFSQAAVMELLEHWYRTDREQAQS